jgi:hypothetical protein
MNYPIPLSTERLARATRAIGFEFTYDSRQAFGAFMDAKVTGPKSAKENVFREE